LVEHEEKHTKFGKKFGWNFFQILNTMQQGAISDERFLTLPQLVKRITSRWGKWKLKFYKLNAAL